MSLVKEFLKNEKFKLSESFEHEEIDNYLEFFKFLKNTFLKSPIRLPIYISSTILGSPNTYFKLINMNNKNFEIERYTEFNFTEQKKSYNGNYYFKLLEDKVSLKFVTETTGREGVIFEFKPSITVTNRKNNFLDCDELYVSIFDKNNIDLGDGKHKFSSIDIMLRFREIKEGTTWW